MLRRLQDVAHASGLQVSHEALLLQTFWSKRYGGSSSSHALMLQGKVAGVAFSKLSQADNVGYIIPWKIVAHFLREYNQHGAFRGCCSVGFRWQDMENSHMRDHYKVHSRPLATLLRSLICPQHILGAGTPPHPLLSAVVQHPRSAGESLGDQRCAYACPAVFLLSSCK